MRRAQYNVTIFAMALAALAALALASCQNFSSRRQKARTVASAETKGCADLMQAILDLKTYGPLIKSQSLQSSYEPVLKKKAKTAYPEIPSHREISLVGSGGAETFDSSELSPGLSSGLLERIREVGGVFDDYKLMSDAKAKDLTLEEKLAILKQAKARAQKSGRTPLEQERAFLKEAAQKLYNFSKDLQNANVMTDVALEPPTFSFPGLGRNHEEAFDYVQEHWQFLIKKTPTEAEGSIIPLPYEFPVANASRFDEMYYWDTYFGLQGLMPSGHLELSQKTVENFLYLIREYGIIPNGNRDYYLSRSQPPFVSSMVRDVFEESLKKQPGRADELKEWLAKRAYPLLKKDFEDFWMNPKTRFDAETGLHHHFDEVNLARPERHSADKELADDWDDPQGLGLDYVDTRAVAESGLDFTDVLGKEASQVANPLLNSMIYKYAKDLEKFALDLGLEDEAKKYAEMAAKKKEAMTKYMWDEESGFFRTYHMGQKKLLPGVHAESYAALFAGVASDEQAKAMKNALMVLERDGGVMSSDLIESHHQWDGLNGWAPLHFFIIKGLDDYGYEKDAQRVAVKIANSYANIFEKEGVFLERIDVLKGTRPIEDGKKYPVQEGFLWTNGFYSWILTKFLK